MWHDFIVVVSSRDFKSCLWIWCSQGIIRISWYFNSFSILDGSGLASILQSLSILWSIILVKITSLLAGEHLLLLLLHYALSLLLLSELLLHLLAILGLLLLAVVEIGLDGFNSHSLDGYDRVDSGCLICIKSDGYQVVLSYLSRSNWLSSNLQRLHWSRCYRLWLLYVCQALRLVWRRNLGALFVHFSWSWCCHWLSDRCILQVIARGFSHAHL